MIIINRKRLLAITSLLMIAVFAFTFQKADRNKTVQTVTLPVSNKVIVLDARASESLMRVHNLAQERQKQKLI